MTPEQRALARRALGLPNSLARSSRNYTAVHPNALAFAPWMEMVEAGLATVEKVGLSGRVFLLTRAGAEAALEPHERLDPEDFPPIHAD
ncbi:hypothetical protein [Aureimonas sp. D3]|uniref:hypothetical protein n=1 Tax=Aureimonas sp. D3 TaxID=1638164 RepID=UPI000783D3CD|nr:hypothetical protein [Aureimonas sp. D3]